MNALNPDDPQYAAIASNRFEIVDDSPSPPKTPKQPAEKFERYDKPLAPGELRPKFDHSQPIIRKENDVPSDFYQKVVDAWNSVPLIEQQLLKSAGIAVICKSRVEGSEGSPAVFYPATDSKKALIHIGMGGMDEFGGGAELYSRNDDVAGSLKHEAGHALFYILKIAHDAEFVKMFDREISRIPVEYIEKDPSLTEKPHVFGECYATIRGRQGPRIEFVKKYFPETLKYVEQQFETK